MDDAATEPMTARGEAEGAQSLDEPQAPPAKPRSGDEEESSAVGLWEEERRVEGHPDLVSKDIGGLGHADLVSKDIGVAGHDPLAEAAMNILRTQKQQEDDVDNAFVDNGDSDSLSTCSGKQPEQLTDSSELGSAEVLARHLTDLRIDIPDPTAKLKRRSSSIAELSDVEATGSLERFSPREDPVGSAVGSLPLHGTLTREGDMVSYVADDLTEKIRQSVGSSRSTSGATTPAYPTTSQMLPWATTPTSITSSSSTTTELGSVSSSGVIPPIDPEAIQDLERQCHRVADSLSLMLGHLSNSLQNMSAITVGHIQTYRDAVEKAGITADQSVKAMYALMAKVEELNFSMPVVYDLAKQIKSLHSKLDELESLCK